MDTYKRLILRNSGNDWISTIFETDWRKVW